MYNFRVLSPDDSEAIYDFIAPYADEAAFKMGNKLCKDKCIAFIRDVASLRFAAYDNHGMAGIVLATTRDTWFDTPQNTIDVFYIRPDHRGTKLARMLAQRAVDIIQHVHGGNIWTNSVSGVNAKNDNLFANLFVKIGFKAVGSRVLFLE